ncbi:MAG: hypothetical protein GEU28_01460 [Dehalococcoidia bacterium]|nr:hypothetical protein [Dehalococcoidia bacterium]
MRDRPYRPDDPLDDPGDLDDVEELDEEADPDYGPLPSDADLGWDSEGLLTDHQESVTPLRSQTFFWAFALLALLAMLTPAIIILFG